MGTIDYQYFWKEALNTQLAFVTYNLWLNFGKLYGTNGQVKKW